LSGFHIFFCAHFCKLSDSCNIPCSFRYGNGISGIKEDELLQKANMVRNQLIEDFKKQVKNSTIGESGYFYVMDYKGGIIVHPDEKTQDLSMYDFAKEMLKNKSGIVEYDWEGKHKIVAYDSYPNNKWIIAGAL